MAYLMFDDVDSALAHWKEFYQGELTNDVSQLGWAGCG